MPTELHWPAIALRLILTVIAGGLLGAERSKTGHVAGLRTTLLVTLAASIAMIQMNLLIPTNGKPADSYAVTRIHLGGRDFPRAEMPIHSTLPVWHPGLGALRLR
jgi:uncharacterized membrane protein YhiD involved in acid resistance